MNRSRELQKINQFICHLYGSLWIAKLDVFNSTWTPRANETLSFRLIRFNLAIETAFPIKSLSIEYSHDKFVWLQNRNVFLDFVKTVKLLSFSFSIWRHVRSVRIDPNCEAGDFFSKLWVKYMFCFWIYPSEFASWLYLVDCVELCFRYQMAMYSSNATPTR